MSPDAATLLPNYSHWRALWLELGYQGSEAWLMQGLSQLLARYREAHRHYHTVTHLAECLHTFEDIRQHLVHPACVGLALYAHDVVYDPTRTDNEAASAAWCTALLQQGGIACPLIARIESLILATRHTAAHPACPEADRDTAMDTAFLLDIDLAILGSAPARFAGYEAQIRQEYRHAPEAAYRQGRLAVLQHFLAQPRCYHTDYFATRLEAAARHNLQQAIAALPT
jgi:predicted metal-dependent HD superfamily phosphohydrolase